MSWQRPAAGVLSVALLYGCATPYDAAESPNIADLARRDAVDLDSLLPTPAPAPEPTPDVQPAEEVLAVEESTVSRDVKKAIENYRKIVDLSPQDRMVQYEARRRLADLQVEVSELDPTAEREGIVSTENSIQLYNSLLDSRPNDPNNDRILYQMARAYQNLGQVDQAIASMRELEAQFPESTLTPDAEFRRAELLFQVKDYPEAEAAYTKVMARGGETPYYERAEYKYGWSVFKQERYEESLNTFLVILDRELPVGAVENLEATLDVVPRAQRELVRDVLRVVSLSFSYMGGGDAITEYLDGRPVRSYEPVLYANLAELFLSKDRFQDAARAYSALADRSPTNPQAPLFQARVIDIYTGAGFPDLVLQAKIDYVNTYDLDQPYWTAHTPEESATAFELLRTNMNEVARHWHATAQAEDTADSERQELFTLASQWYARYLERFPEAEDRPGVHFLFAETLFETRRYAQAAREFEITAWEYPEHDKSADAGYSAVLARHKLQDVAGETELPTRVDESVATSLRFADSFPDHPEVTKVLTRAAEDLYRIKAYARTIEVATRITAIEPPAPAELQRVAWTLIAYSHFDQEQFAEAEPGLQEAIARTPADLPQHLELRQSLAQAIYKQGEQSRDAGDIDTAVNHFLRVKTALPGSAIAASGDYDAAAALIGAEQWEKAADVLQAFRVNYPAHELQPEVTRKLAGVYLNNDQPVLAANEFERIAVDPREAQNIRREATLEAAGLLDEAGIPARARNVYALYVDKYPQPFAQAVKAYERLIAYSEDSGDTAENRRWLRALIAAVNGAGDAATDRSRVLAAQASMTLADDARKRYEAMRVTDPLNVTLPAKKRAMDEALAAYQVAIGYAIAEIATESTYRIGNLYLELSRGLLDSERPQGLDPLELEQYELLLEEQAFPLEENAIDIHVTNTQRLKDGIYDEWVRASYARLAEILPARFDKPELSEDVVEQVY